MLILISSLLWAIAVGVATWAILSISFSVRTNRGRQDRFELERRAELRGHSFAFRHFEPLVDELATEIEKGKLIKYEEFAESLSASGEPLAWKAPEFLATKMIEGVMAAFVVILFTMILGYSLFTTLVLALLGAIGYVWLAMSGTKKKALKRRIVVKRSFAAAIDLLALMMEVGGSFQDSIRVVARENRGKPIGDELNLIVSDIDMGKPRRNALDNFAARINDEDISEVVFACNESEDLGVPIAQTLKTQADRIRAKRTSWAEKASQEAEVTLVFPSMLIMLACLLTVGAPFVLQGLATYLGAG
jgi:tight adherence protein C